MSAARMVADEWGDMVTKLAEKMERVWCVYHQFDKEWDMMLGHRPNFWGYFNHELLHWAPYEWQD